MPGRNAFSVVNTDTVAHDLPLAQQRERNRGWEKSHPARRYLIPVEVRDEVAALAEALMENVDPVACVLFDYAETCHTRGTLKFKPRLNPTGRKHTLDVGGSRHGTDTAAHTPTRIGEARRHTLPLTQRTNGCLSFRRRPTRQTQDDCRGI